MDPAARTIRLNVSFTLFAVPCAHVALTGTVRAPFTQDVCRMGRRRTGVCVFEFCRIRRGPDRRAAYGVYGPKRHRRQMLATAAGLLAAIIAIAIFEAADSSSRKSVPLRSARTDRRSWKLCDGWEERLRRIHVEFDRMRGVLEPDHFLHLEVDVWVLMKAIIKHTARFQELAALVQFAEGLAERATDSRDPLRTPPAGDRRGPCRSLNRGRACS